DVAGEDLHSGWIQRRPSFSMSWSAAAGPHAPAAWFGKSRGTRVPQTSRIGSAIRHAASTMSARWKSVESPTMQSYRSVSQPLARSQIERHACPSPVLDEELQGAVCLRAGIRRDIRLAAIAGDADLAVEARPVLPPHGPLQDLLRRHRPDRLEHLDLLVSDR